jgi:hypothetical protein
LKKQEDTTLWLSYGTCSYILMYINAIARGVMLYLQHDFYNTVYKIKHKSHIVWESPPTPPQGKNLVAHQVF